MSLTTSIESSLKKAADNPLIWPEWAQQMVMNSSEFISSSPKLKKIALFVIGQVYDTIPQNLSTEVFWVPYKSGLWLWPGIIKEPFALDLWTELPFWFLVLGGITGNGQPWNAQPRIWRNDTNGDIFNAMWLPWTGVDSVVKKLEYLDSKRRLTRIPLWVNLCNSATTKEDDKAWEFAHMVELLYEYADVIELNFSCPNQAGVDGMQKSAWLLKQIIQTVQKKNEEMAIKTGKDKLPIIVKIWPIQPNPENPIANDDLSEDEVKMITLICSELWVDAITVNNTAKNHTWVSYTPGKWGLSWFWLHHQTRETIKTVRSINKDILIVWAGWVGTGRNLEEKKDTATGLLFAWADIQYMVSWFVQAPISNVNIVNKEMSEYMAMTHGKTEEINTD
jgi:dihydroorotate dehydrogenase